TLHAVSYVILFIHSSAPRRDLPSFPTRRSSDLPAARGHKTRRPDGRVPRRHPAAAAGWARAGRRRPRRGPPSASPAGCAAWPSRSEEHTSELQSRENLVCRLLLEKKKKKAGNAS